MDKKKYLDSTTVIEEIISFTVDKVNAIINKKLNEKEIDIWTDPESIRFYLQRIVSLKPHTSVELYYNVEHLMICENLTFENISYENDSKKKKNAMRNHDIIRTAAIKRTIKNYIYAILLDLEIHKLVNDFVFDSPGSKPKKDYIHNNEIIRKYLHNLRYIATKNEEYKHLRKIPAFDFFLESGDTENYRERLLTMFENAHFKSKFMYKRYNMEKIKYYSILPALTLVYLNKSKGIGTGNDPVQMSPLGTRKRRVKLYSTLDPYVVGSFDKELDASYKKLQTYLNESNSNEALFDKEDNDDDSLTSYRKNILNHYFEFFNAEIDKQGNYYYKQNLFNLFALTQRSIKFNDLNNESDDPLTEVYSSYYALIQLITLRKYTDFLIDPDDNEDWDNRANTELISDITQIDWFILNLINYDLSFYNDEINELASVSSKDIENKYLEIFFPEFFKELTGFSYSEIIKDVMETTIGKFNDKAIQDKFYQLIDTAEYKQYSYSLLEYFGTEIKCRIQESLDPKFFENLTRSNIDYKSYINKILNVLKAIDQLLTFEHTLL